MMKQRILLSVRIALAIVLALFLMPGISSAEGGTYIHGFFHYTVGDGSVTITAYTGNESSVRVPAMIGGNPVNTIGRGAFADNEAVHTIYLPDTITLIEAGAFGPGQRVVYSHQNAGQTEAETVDPSAQEVPGIRDESGNLITTDNQGNLILVDSEGNERVLDDSQTYSITESDNGTEILNEEGNAVRSENGTVVFTDADENVVTADGKGSTTVSSDMEGFSQEEAEVDLTGDRSDEIFSVQEPEIAGTTESEAEIVTEPAPEQVSVKVEVKDAPEPVSQTAEVNLAPEMEQELPTGNRLLWIILATGIILCGTVLVVLALKRKKKEQKEI